ncbi:Isoleucine--tRNA ligase [Talaromyces islandicus]|uniref:Isoleucine--tRNA ligase n=1 Tax=Talaromyces islandicus TaxID=28573 RepID=A0A0U1LXW1_TALIS|nr:Isoleucine--tRNA ligase [Talaromyces islandicus]
MSAENIQSPSSLTTQILNQPPSCLEFCPDSPDYFIIGTYLLHEDKDDESAIKQTKTGSLQLWHLDAANHEPKQKQLLSLPYAVFDLHFHPRRPTVLGIAGSDGSVSLYRVSRENENQDPQIRLIWARKVHEEEHIPALFLAWTPRDWFQHSAMKGSVGGGEGFAVTFSDGRTSVFATSSRDKDITEGDGSDLLESNFQPRESIEAWFVALADYIQPNSGDSVAYSFTGNDFGSLNVRQFRSAQDQDDGLTEDVLLEELQVANTDDRARHHAAGVTSILPLPIPMLQNAPVLLTGSYDEYLRVYHATVRGAVLAEELLGGGVWRLQIIHTEDSESGVSFFVLASCMHAGARIVRVSWKRGSLEELGEWDIQVLAQFTEHESMNYASGVWKTSADSSELVCVSSSFYDKRLCLWKVQV